MNKLPTTAFGQNSLTEELKKFQAVQTSLLKNAFSDDSISGRTRELKSFLGAIVSTGVAISRLAQEDLLNECTMLGRAFFERSINFSCLLLCDEQKFKEYHEHFIQKAYRKLNREFKAGNTKMGIKFNGEIDLNSDSQLKEAVEKYSKNGREVKDFLRLKIPEKLDLIRNLSGTDIAFFLHYQAVFYEDGSEAMHGSFYGAVFHLGVAQPGFDPADVDSANIHLQKMLALFLLDIGTIIHQLLVIIGKFENIQTLVEGSKHNFDMAGAMLKIAMKEEKAFQETKK